ADGAEDEHADRERGQHQPAGAARPAAMIEDHRDHEQHGIQGQVARALDDARGEERRPPQRAGAPAASGRRARARPADPAPVRRLPSRSPMRPAKGCSSAIATRYDAMRNAARPRDTWRSRAMSGRPTAIMVELSGTSDAAVIAAANVHRSRPERREVTAG